MKVEIDKYSGRPNPIIDIGEQDLDLGEPRLTTENKLGYRGLILHLDSGEFLVPLNSELEAKLFKIIENVNKS